LGTNPGLVGGSGGRACEGVQGEAEFVIEAASAVSGVFDDHQAAAGPAPLQRPCGAERAGDVGLSKAKEIILTGDLYPITEFAAQGLINRMVEPRKLRAATLELLGSVTASTREVIAAQKGLFETWLSHGLQHGIDNSIDVFADVFRAPATAEAIAQYQQSRSRP
jgi:hypothetical protein